MFLEYLSRDKELSSKCIKISLQSYNYDYISNIWKKCMLKGNWLVLIDI